MNLAVHNAPPVLYPLGRSRFQAGMLCALWLSGLIVALLWFYAAPQYGWRGLLAVVCLAAAGSAAYAGWRNAPSGRLSWDGQRWHWESPGYQAGIDVQQLSVMADFQRIMLLRIENQAHVSMWLWAGRGALPERWADLRRAVYSPQRAASAARLHNS